MMASINPLGERARGNRWRHTATAFTAGCLLGGWALGASAAAVGLLVAAASRPPATAVAAGAAMGIAFAAGVVELAGWRVPTLHRQVDEAWLGRYRGWVYGSGFGAQLGAGLATTVTTAAVYAVVAMLVLLGATGRLAEAQAVGAVFGLCRAVPVLGARRLHDPESLRRRARQVAAGATAGRLASGASLCSLALLVAVGL
jgi:hypothetical protein